MDSSNSNNNNDNNNDNETKSKFPTHIFLPSFLNKEMPIGTFFVTAGALSAVGFGLGLLIGFRKTGGIKNTLRSAPPGVVREAGKALLAGTAICAGFTTALVYYLKSQHNVNTVKDLGDLMRGKKDIQATGLILIDEKTYLEKKAQLNNSIHQEDSGNNELSDIDKESLDAVKAYFKVPTGFNNNNDSNDNNNNNNHNHNHNNNNNNNHNNHNNNNSNNQTQK